MPQYLSPGVYVEEVSSTLKPIQGVGTSTGAFVGFAEKGPIGEPILIGNRAEFFTKYGGFIVNADLAYGVNLFFQNGGTRCYVVRTSAHDIASGDPLALAAGVTITDGQGNNALRIDAASPGATGDSIASPGAWGNSLAVSIEHAWNPQTLTPTITTDLNDVSFVGVDNGWAVGDAGEIFATSDAGATWEQQTLSEWGTFAPVTTALNAVQFVDARTGWAVGDASVIGATIPWTHRNSGTAADLNSLQFVDEFNGWAAGAGGVIVTTQTGGTTWSTVSSGVSGDINALHMRNAEVGAAVTVSGEISFWDGTTWASTSISGTPAVTTSLNSVRFVGDATAWTVGDGGIIASTGDGGATWTRRTVDDLATGTPVTDNLNAMAFLNATTGWAVGENGRILFFNGVDWVDQTSPTTDNLNAIHIENDSAAWAVGANGAIFFWDGSRWEQQNPPTGITSELLAVAFANTTHGWAVGAGDTILHTDDGGRNWRTQTGSGIGNLRSVNFINAASGWICGDTGGVLVTVNGGTTWTLQQTGVNDNLLSAQIDNSTTGSIVGENGRIMQLGQSWISQEDPAAVAANLRAVQFVDRDRGWAVGVDTTAPDGVIMDTSDGGANWTRQTTGSGGLVALRMVNATTGWAVGANSRIVAWDGAAWTAQTITSPPTPAPDLAALHFVDGNNGWVVGTSGYIVATADGGANWVVQNHSSALTPATSQDLNAVHFQTTTRGWAVGAAGTVVATTDGGATWAAQTSNTIQDLTQVGFVNETAGWAVGANGAIIATADGGTTWVPQSSGTRQPINALQIVSNVEGYAVGATGTIVAMTEGMIDEPQGFRLTVFDRRDEVEVYEAVTIDRNRDAYIETAVNNISNNIRVTAGNHPPTTVATDRPQVVTMEALTGGADGIDDADIRNSDFTGADGLGAFDDVDDINIVAIPDSASRDVMLQGINYCENRQDCFFVAHATEAEDTAQEALAFKQATGPEYGGQNAFNSSFGALYVPWIEVPDPLTNKTRLVAPSAAVAGRYSATDVRRGVHKAPAGREDGLLRGVLGLDRQFSQAEIATLNPQNVNTLRTITGVGSVIWGARTVSADASLRYVSTRRLLLFIEESIDEGTQWVVFEPNTPALWRSIERNIRAFLRVVWRSGALFGDVEDNAFYVKCDAETNPPDSIEAGMVVTEIGVAIVKPAEFVIFRISQARAGSVISE